MLQAFWLDGSGAGNCAAGKAGPGASCCHWNIVLASDADGPGNAPCVFWQYDDLGEAAVDRRVVFVDEQILGRMQHPMAADCTLEISDQGASLHALSLAVPFVITKAVATPGYAGASF